MEVFAVEVLFVLLLGEIVAPSEAGKLIMITET